MRFIKTGLVALLLVASHCLFAQIETPLKLITSDDNTFGAFIQGDISAFKNTFVTRSFIVRNTSGSSFTGRILLKDVFGSSLSVEDIVVTYEGGILPQGTGANTIDVNWTGLAKTLSQPVSGTDYFLDITNLPSSIGPNAGLIFTRRVKVIDCIDANVKGTSEVYLSVCPTGSATGVGMQDAWSSSTATKLIQRIGKKNAEFINIVDYQVVNGGYCAYNNTQVTTDAYRTISLVAKMNSTSGGETVQRFGFYLSTNSTSTGIPNDRVKIYKAILNSSGHYIKTGTQIIITPDVDLNPLYNHIPVFQTPGSTCVEDAIKHGFYEIGSLTGNDAYYIEFDVLNCQPTIDLNNFKNDNEQDYWSAGWAGLDDCGSILKVATNPSYEIFDKNEDLRPTSSIYENNLIGALFGNTVANQFTYLERVTSLFGDGIGNNRIANTFVPYTSSFVSKSNIEDGFNYHVNRGKIVVALKMEAGLDYYTGPAENGYFDRLHFRNPDGKQWLPTSQNGSLSPLYGIPTDEGPLKNYNEIHFLEFDLNTLYSLYPDLSTSTSLELREALYEFLNASDLVYSMKANCNEPNQKSLASYTVEMYFVLDASCSNPWVFPSSKITKEAKIMCPGCMFPGGAGSGVSIKRNTFGYEDRDDNHLPDSPAATWTESEVEEVINSNGNPDDNIRTSLGILGDHLKMKTKYYLTGSQSCNGGTWDELMIGPLTYSYLFIDFPKDTIGIDNTVPVKFKITSGGTTYSFTAPVSAIVDAGNGPTQHIFTLNTSVLNMYKDASSAALPAGFRFHSFDKIEFEFELNVLLNTATTQSYQEVFFTHSPYFSAVPLSERTGDFPQFLCDPVHGASVKDANGTYHEIGLPPYDNTSPFHSTFLLCEGYEGIFNLAPIIQTLSNDGAAGSTTLETDANCIKEKLYAIQSSIGKIDEKRLFLNEIREAPYLNEIDVIVPHGYHIIAFFKQSILYNNNLPDFIIGEQKLYDNLVPTNSSQVTIGSETFTKEHYVFPNPVILTDAELSNPSIYHQHRIFDEKSEQRISVYYEATCSELASTPDLINDQPTSNASFKNKLYMDHDDMSPVDDFTIPNPVRFLKPFSGLTSSISTTGLVAASSSNFKVDYTITNGISGSPARYPFITIEYNPGVFANFELTSIGAIPISLVESTTLVNGNIKALYQITIRPNETIIAHRFSLLKNESLSFTIKGQLIQCFDDPFDPASFKIGYGWDCNGYPTSIGEIIGKCFTAQDELKVYSIQSGLQSNLTAVTEGDVCASPQIKYSHRLVSTGSQIEELTYTIDLPAELTLSESSIHLQYGATAIAPADYILINNSTSLNTGLYSLQLEKTALASVPFAGAVIQGSRQEELILTYNALVGTSPANACNYDPLSKTKIDVTAINFCSTQLPLNHAEVVPEYSLCSSCCFASAAAGTDQAGCLGTTFTLNAVNPQAGYTYTWTGNGQTFTGTTINLTPGVAGYPSAGTIIDYTLTVTATDNVSCLATDIVSLQVYAIPPVSIVTADGKGSILIPTCHETVTLQATIDANYTYQWSYRATVNEPVVPISGATASSYMVTMGHAGNYTVTIVDGVHNCTNSTTVTVTDAISISGDDQICPGEKANLSLTLNGLIGDYLVQWFQDGGAATTTPSGTYGNYYALVVLSNPQCTLITPTKQVLLLPAPSPYTVDGGSINFCPEDYPNGVVLTAVAPSSTPTPITDWAWTPTGGSTSTITAFTSGAYGISVTGENGCSNSSGTVLVAPSITITQKCNVDGSTTLTASANVLGITTYIWTNSSSTVIGTGASITVNDDGIYYVTTSDLRCNTTAETTVCRNTTAANVSIREDFDKTNIDEPCEDGMMVGKTDFTCVNKNVVLGMGQGPDKWIGKTRVTSNAATEIAGTDAVGLWSGMHYPNTRIANDKYFLATDGDVTSSDMQLWHTEVNVENCATYAFRAMVVNLLQVDKQELPEVYFKIDDHRLNQAIVFTNDTWKQFGGTWKSNITGTVEISIMLKSGGFVGRDIGLDEIYFHKVDCSQLSSELCDAVAEVGSAKYICAGGSIEIGNNTSTPGLAYAWTAPGFTSSTINPTVSPTVTTEYTLKVTDAANHCSATDKVTVTIIEPSVSIQLAEQSTCGTDFVASLFNGMGSSQYAWFINGTQSETNSTGLFSPAGLKVGDKVKCKLLSACTAQPFSNEITVTSTNNPVIDNVAATPDVICKNESSILSLDGSGGTAPYTYEWKQGTTVISTGSTVSVSPTSYVNYTVTLTDQNGCKSAQKSILVSANNTSAMVVVVNQSTLCQGVPLNIIYHIAPCARFNSGNVFTAQLSNASGVFHPTNPTVIGSVVSSDPGSMSITIPTATPIGNGYRIRLVSSDISYISPDNGSNLSVIANNGDAVISASVANTTFCAGASMTVSFNRATCAYVNSPNVYTAQLSDASGNFANPINLGTLNSTASSGNIVATIPETVQPGSKYRVRVVSSNLVHLGTSNSVDLTITTACHALSFDGVDDRVTIPNHSAYNVGNGNFTIEAWIKASPTSPSQSTLLSNRVNGSANTFLFVVCTSGTQLLLQINGVNYASSTFTNIYDNACHHVAVTRTSGALQFFIDGVQKGGAYSTLSINTTNSLLIGYDLPDGNNTAFKGVINNVRILNMAINVANNMNQLMQGTNTSLKGSWPLNESGTSQVVFDASSTQNNGYRGTNSSTADAQDPSKVAGGSCLAPLLRTGLAFDGVDDRITLPNAPYLSGDFTVEAWVNMPAQNAGVATPVILSGRTTQNSGFLFTTNSNGTKLMARINNVDYTHPVAFTNIHDNNCHHIAVTRSASSLTFFVDGVMKGTAVATNANLSSNTMNWWIGDDYFSTAINNSLKGNINELRIWNRSFIGSDLENRAVVLPTNTPNLIGYWKAQETLGELVHDASIYNNHGYLGSNATQFDAQNPMRNNISCYNGDRQIEEKSLLDSNVSRKESAVFIYPNPFEKGTTIVINGTRAEQSQLRIIDLNGLTVSEEKVWNNEQTIIAQQLPGGVYIVEVITSTGKSMHKIIKLE